MNKLKIQIDGIPVLSLSAAEQFQEIADSGIGKLRCWTYMSAGWHGCKKREPICSNAMMPCHLVKAIRCFYGSVPVLRHGRCHCIPRLGDHIGHHKRYWTCRLSAEPHAACIVMSASPAELLDSECGAAPSVTRCEWLATSTGRRPPSSSNRNASDFILWRMIRIQSSSFFSLPQMNLVLSSNTDQWSQDFENLHQRSLYTSANGLGWFDLTSNLIHLLDQSCLVYSYLVNNDQSSWFKSKKGGY